MRCAGALLLVEALGLFALASASAPHEAGNSSAPSRLRGSTTGTRHSLVGRCDEASWLDLDHGLICGPCKVLVDHFDSKYQTCDEYCFQNYAGCSGAWEEVDDTCQVKHELGCGQRIASSDAICECTPWEVQTPGGACDEASWSDLDHGLTCGDCKVLVNHFDRKYHSCDNYCHGVGRTCLGAWEEVNDDCEVKSRLMCGQSIDSSDAICECGMEAVGRPEAACDEATWPDLDHGLTCGDCEVLVNHFDTKYHTCDGYCNSMGRLCMGAWEEVNDNCEIKYEMACSQHIDSSDALCKCSQQ